MSQTVKVTVTKQDGGCELTLTHEMSATWASYADRTRDGWTRMLTVLASVLG